MMTITVSWVLFSTFILTLTSASLETALTFQVPARKEQCFYEDVQEKHEIEMDFQVVDGGDLDIDFQAYDSSLKRIAINRRESYGTHTFTVKESGVYKFCFSNKFSKLTSKTVFMDVYVDDGVYTDDKAAEEGASLHAGFTSLHKQVDNIKSQLFKTQVQLQLSKAQRNKDQKIQNSNKIRVDRWSMVQCAFMVLMATVQVYLLKQLFKEDKTAKRQAKI